MLTLADAVRSLSVRRARRTFANVFFKSVLKLGVYRKLGSRIDFMGHRECWQAMAIIAPARKKFCTLAHTHSVPDRGSGVIDHLH